MTPGRMLDHHRPARRVALPRPRPGRLEVQRRPACCVEGVKSGCLADPEGPSPRPSSPQASTRRTRAPISAISTCRWAGPDLRKSTTVAVQCIAQHVRTPHSNLMLFSVMTRSQRAISCRCGLQLGRRRVASKSCRVSGFTTSGDLSARPVPCWLGPPPPRSLGRSQHSQSSAS
jgi:hypothetical protein